KKSNNYQSNMVNSGLNNNDDNLDFELLKNGKYEWGKIIGAGSYGEVSLVKDINTGIEYVAKRFKSMNEICDEENYEENNENWSGFDTTILREVSMLKLLKQPNIIGLVDYF